MTPQAWNEIKESLKSFYTQVNLMCDGFKVSLALVRVTQFKNVIRVYVNGVIKTKWLIEDCEERRRFFRPVTKSLLSAKEKTAMKKLSKKRQIEIDLKTKYVYYLPDWTSFTALKKHLTQNNNSIELIH